MGSSRKKLNGLTIEDIRPSIYARLDTSERLSSKSVLNAETRCLEYTGNIDQYGYGRIKIRDRNFGAHRVAYVIYVGDIPEGHQIMHSCDNPCCINPCHLTIGTPKENVMDSIRKGRSHNRMIYPQAIA